MNHIPHSLSDSNLELPSSQLNMPPSVALAYTKFTANQKRIAERPPNDRLDLVCREIENRRGSFNPDDRKNGEEAYNG